MEQGRHFQSYYLIDTCEINIEVPFSRFGTKRLRYPQKGKKKPKLDEDCGAKESNIAVCDEVLMPNMVLSNKLTTNIKLEFEIVEKGENDVVVRRNGREYA